MKISVAVCTYNGEKFLNQQIDSILAQSVKADEIIICDDRSTDNTLEILHHYEERFPEVFKICVNEKNLRSVKNFEKAISLCSGDLIFLCDQDDIWETDKVEVFGHYFDENQHIQAASSNGFVIDDQNNTLDKYTVWDAPAFLEQKNLDTDHFRILTLSGNYATGAAMAVKKQFAEKTFPFPLMEGLHHDEWMAVLAAEKNQFGFIHKKLFRYRCHRDQQVGGIFFNKNESGKQNIIRKYSLERPLTSFRDFKTQFRSLRTKEKKFENYLKNNTNDDVVRILSFIKKEKTKLELRAKSENILFFLFFKYLY